MMEGFLCLSLDEVAAFAGGYDTSHLPGIYREMCALWADISMLEISLGDGREYWGFPRTGPLQAVVAVTPRSGPSELNARTVRYLGSLAGTVRMDWGGEPFRLRAHPTCLPDFAHLSPRFQVDTFRRNLDADMVMPGDVELHDVPPADIRPLWHMLWLEHERSRSAGVPAAPLRAEADAELAQLGQRWAVIRDAGAPVSVGRWLQVRETAILCGAYTVPPWRQQGLGLRLIDARLADAARVGCTVAVSQAADITSIHNLERAGFERTGTMYYIV